MRGHRLIATAGRAAGCALLALIAVATQALGADWQRYTNTRYGVTIDYPADLFAIQPAPPDNAGRNFEAPRAKARFHIYSHANAFNLSIEELQAADVLELGDAAAKKLTGRDWYQVVAIKDADTILRKVQLSEGGTMIHRLEIAYPTQAATTFQPVVSRLTRSFSVDPSIPEKAGEAATPPPAPPPRTGAAGWQRFDSIALGLRIPGYRGMAGVSAEVPAHWIKADMPEPNVIEFDGPQATDEEVLYVIFRADLRRAGATLASEAKIIKNRLSEGADNYRLLSERTTQIASRPAIVFSMQFSGSDSPALLREDVAIVDGGKVFYFVHSGAPETRYAGSRKAFDHAIETITFAE